MYIYIYIYIYTKTYILSNIPSTYIIKFKFNSNMDFRKSESSNHFFKN